MTATATAWKLPDLDTTYHLEDHEPMTLGQMLDGIDEDLTGQAASPERARLRAGRGARRGWRVRRREAALGVPAASKEHVP